MITRRIHELTVERMSYMLEDIESNENWSTQRIEKAERELAAAKDAHEKILEQKEWCNEVLSEAKDALIKLDGK